MVNKKTKWDYIGREDNNQAITALQWDNIAR